MRYVSFRVALLLAGVAILAAPCSVLAEATLWNFDDGTLTATYGNATLSYFNGTTTSSSVQFGTTDNFGIAAMQNGTAKVMKFSAFTKYQGLLGDCNCGPNGGGVDGVNQYTVIFDLLAPDPRPKSTWLSLLESNPNNTKDSQIAVTADSLYGYGDTGGFGGMKTYNGTIQWGQWYRLAMVVDATKKTMDAYINGAHVGTTVGTTQNGFLGVDKDPALWATMPGNQHSFLLLADNSGETGSGYLNSFYFNNRVMSGTEIAAFGGPDARGIVPTPEPGTLALLGSALLGLIAYAWRRRK